MSILQYPEATHQIFRYGTILHSTVASLKTATISSWSPIKPILVNRSESLDSLSSKENQSPVHFSVKPLRQNGQVEKAISRNGSEEEVRDERKIDVEIEEIQMEIGLLSSSLGSLWLEKAEQKLKSLERRRSGVKVVPSKFMGQQQSVENANSANKIEEQSSMSSRSKFQRRGFSLGPEEIEIKKSCFWKLQDIDEETAEKERRNSFSVSPKPRKTISRTQAVTITGSKRNVKKEDGALSIIQAKETVQRGREVSAAKKPLKLGSIVASRYNQDTVQSTRNSAMRKWSLPENGKSRGFLLEVGGNQGTESRVKKRWEISSEIVVHRNLVDDNSPQEISEMPDMLQCLRTIQCTNDNSPMDSAPPAKRVEELIARKSFFAMMRRQSKNFVRP
ncbi:unnamed protein product [Camellia sinensis]